MSTFLRVAPVEVLAAYWASLAVFVSHTLWRLTTRRYVFSPYTIPVYTIAFALYLIAPMQYDDQAWVVLGQLDATGYYPFLNLSIGVNAVGLAVVLLVMWYVESRPRSNPMPPLLTRLPDISIESIRNVLIGGLVLFAGVLAIVGAIPLFGARTIFSAHSELRPVYNFANFVILFATSSLIVWSFLSRSGRFVLVIAMGVVAMLLTGGRASVLSTLELTTFMWIYGKYPNRPGRATALITASLACVAVAGIFLASFRVGRDFDIGGILSEVAYANTFSDIRDGAFITAAWEAHESSAPLEGRSYLAGFLSFLPSSVSDFRSTWSWGYYTTEGLMGWANHFGFRGGWSLEAFMNFGFAGVVGAAVLCGWLLGRLELLFHRKVVARLDVAFGSAYPLTWVGYSIFTVLIASSATYNLYSLLIALMAAWLMTQFQHTSESGIARLRFPHSVGQGRQ